VGCTFCARVCPDYCIQVERIDDPAGRAVTRYDFDISKCCFCGLCAEQCPTHALQHTGQYELSFFSRQYTMFDKDEMVRSSGGTRATGAQGPAPAQQRGQAARASLVLAEQPRVPGETEGEDAK
jgi:formate hydrogenlyase subunit 6/NADH:ubiquinone oxidoreductase subunit I